MYDRTGTDRPNRNRDRTTKITETELKLKRPFYLLGRIDFWIRNCNWETKYGLTAIRVKLCQNQQKSLKIGKVIRKIFGQKVSFGRNRTKQFGRSLTCGILSKVIMVLRLVTRSARESTFCSCQQFRPKMRQIARSVLRVSWMISTLICLTKPWIIWLPCRSMLLVCQFCRFCE